MSCLSHFVLGVNTCEDVFIVEIVEEAITTHHDNIIIVKFVFLVECFMR